MKKNFCIPVVFGMAFIWIVLNAGTALATQSHGEPEGLYAHQIGHIFFALSMGILIYWLKARKLVLETGWRYIQYAALFLILWNLDTLAVHSLDEMIDILSVRYNGNWQIEIVAREGYKPLESVYYVAKLDHLLCVPALVFLYYGLKRLLRESDGGVARTEKP